MLILGGAISHAKGALTNWWSNLLVSPDNRPAICEGEDVVNVMEKTNGNNKQSNSDAEIENGEEPVLTNNKKNNYSQNIPETCEKVEHNAVKPNGDIPVVGELDNAKQENAETNFDSSVIQTV